MVVVQVCFKLMRLISTSNLAGPPAAAAPAGNPAMMPHAPTNSLRLSFIGPPRRDEQAGPMLVVEVRDLHHGMLVCSRVDELAVADVHPRVADLLDGRSEIKEIAGQQVSFVDRLETLPICLWAGISWHQVADPAEQHLNEPRAIVAVCRRAAPQIR